MKTTEKNLFTAQESRYNKNYFSIVIPEIVHDLVKGSSCSRVVISSRVFGLTYPNYLKMVSSNYNAILFGKGYITALFPKTTIDKFLEDINGRWTYWLRQIKEENIEKC